jgi:MFS family permease
MTTLLFGTWVERNGPFRATAITLFLTPAGWALAALGSYNANYGVEILYGVAHGVGTGFAYISVTSALQRFFPDFKGLATGVAVMGFGLGSFIWTTFGKNLMTPLATNPYGIAPLAVYQVQGIFAAIFFCLIALALPFLREPPPGFTPGTAQYKDEASCRGAVVRALATQSAATHATKETYTFTQALFTQEMLLVGVTFFCAEVTGLVFLSSAADMIQNTFGLTSTDASTYTSYLNLVNFAGRVGWGFVSDKVGRKSFYLFSLSTQAFAVGLMGMWISTGNFPLWLLSFLIIGSLYGGGFGVIPAFVSDVFGPKISAATHGVMIGVWASAAVIGIPCFTSYTSTDYHLSGSTKITNPSAYMHNTLWLCALPTVGFVAAACINVKAEDRAVRVAKRDVRVRVGAYVVRVNLAEGGVAVLGPQAQADEYAAAFPAAGKGKVVSGDSDPVVVSVDNAVTPALPA